MTQYFRKIYVEDVIYLTKINFHKGFSCDVISNQFCESSSYFRPSCGFLFALISSRSEVFNPNLRLTMIRGYVYNLTSLISTPRRKCVQVTPIAKIN